MSAPASICVWRASMTEAGYAEFRSSRSRFSMTSDTFLMLSLGRNGLITKTCSGFFMLFFKSIYNLIMHP